MLEQRHEYRRRATQGARSASPLEGAVECGAHPTSASPREKDWFTFERVTALFRQTRMGQYYLHPSEPPDLLKVVFPAETDRRCVSPVCAL